MLRGYREWFINVGLLCIYYVCLEINNIMINFLEYIYIVNWYGVIVYVKNNIIV